MKLEPRERRKVNLMELEPNSSYLLLFKNASNAHQFTKAGVRTKPKKASAKKAKKSTVPPPKKAKNTRQNKNNPTHNNNVQFPTINVLHSAPIPTAGPLNASMTSATPSAAPSQPSLPPLTSSAVFHQMFSKPANQEEATWFWKVAIHPPALHVMEKEYQIWSSDPREPSSRPTVRLMSPSGESVVVNFHTMTQDGTIPLQRDNSFPTVWYWHYVIQPPYSSMLETNYQRWLSNPNRLTSDPITITLNNESTTVNFNTMMQGAIGNQLPLVRTVGKHSHSSSIPFVPPLQQSTVTTNLLPPGQAPVWQGVLPTPYSQVFELEYQAWLSNPNRHSAPPSRIALFDGTFISLDFNRMCQNHAYPLQRTVPSLSFPSSAPVTTAQSHTPNVTTSYVPFAIPQINPPKTTAPPIILLNKNATSEVPSRDSIPLANNTMPTSAPTAMAMSSVLGHENGPLSREESQLHRWEILIGELWINCSPFTSKETETQYLEYKKQPKSTDYALPGGYFTVNFDKMEMFQSQNNRTYKIRRVLNF